MELVVLDGDGEIEAAVCPRNTIQTDLSTCVNISSDTCDVVQVYN